MNKLIIIITSLMLLSLPALTQEAGKREILFEQCKKFGQAEIQFTYPGYETLSEIGRHISVRNVRDNIVNAVLSEREIDDFLSMKINYKLIEGDPTKSVLCAQTVEEAMNWDIYPTYQQYDSIVHLFAKDHPGICRVDTIGESVEGRLILVIKISDNVDEDEDEPEVFFTSTMHGDELAGFVLMLRFTEHLLINSSSGGLEQRLIDSLEIWINPLANPDGTYDGDIISSPTRYNADGYDLNRNFPDPTKSYVEVKENLAMINFMNEHDFIISANFHSGAEVLNFPWDRGVLWDSRIHADSIWFYQICRAYADTVHEYSIPEYMIDLNDGVTMGYDWYVAYGTRQDFVSYEQQGREVTIELDNIWETAGSYLPVLWDYNYRSLLKYLENASYGFHGNVVDDITGDPLFARILIIGHDKDSSHVYTDSLTGSFTRLIQPGSWNVRISSDGYYDKVINIISVEEGIQTYKQVRLTKDPTNVDELFDNEIKMWPVPAVNELFIDLPDGLGRGSSFLIIDITGRLMQNIEDIHGIEQMRIDVSHLKKGIYLCLIVDRIDGNTHSLRFIKY